MCANRSYVSRFDELRGGVERLASDNEQELVTTKDRIIRRKVNLRGHRYTLAVARMFRDPGSASLETRDIPLPGTKAENPQ